MKVKVLTATNVLQTPSKGNWWPDQVFKDDSVVYVMSIPSKQWRHLTVFVNFSQKYCKHHYNVDFIAGDANAAAYNTTRGVPRFVQILGCRHVERNATRDGTPTWKQTSSWFLLYITTFLSFVQQIILIVASIVLLGGWVIAEGEGSKELSRPMKYWQSYDCTSRLWSPSIRTSLEAPKQRSLDTTNRSNLALSYSCDHSWDAIQKLPWLSKMEARDEDKK